MVFVLARIVQLVVGADTVGAHDCAVEDEEVALGPREGPDSGEQAAPAGREEADGLVDVVVDGADADLEARGELFVAFTFA